MKINVYNWHETDNATREKILKRSETDISGVRDIVAPIIDDVRKNGDRALVKYAKKFDGADIDINNIRATDEEFAQAAKNLDDKLKDSIKYCADNVRKFHQIQKDREERLWLSEVAPGIWAGEQISPLPSVGLYVPRGKGAFPSVMYMLSMPAVVAGIQKSPFVLHQPRTAVLMMHPCSQQKSAASKMSTRPEVPRRLPRWLTAPKRFQRL